MNVSILSYGYGFLSMVMSRENGHIHILSKEADSDEEGSKREIPDEVENERGNTIRVKMASSIGEINACGGRFE
jgi:hypothetical protein